jgi:hypothetical protein
VESSDCSIGPSYHVRSRSLQLPGRLENSISGAPSIGLGHRTIDFHSVLLVSLGAKANRVVKNSNTASIPSE